MTHATGVPGGPTGTALYFGQVASAEPDATDLVDRKACEGGCGGYFYRRRPVFAKDGEKICAACKVRLERDVETASKGRAMLIGDQRYRRKLEVA